jgi:hypothetical protein
MKMPAVAAVGSRRRLGPGAMRRIAPTIRQAAILRAEGACQMGREVWLGSIC